MKAIPGANTTAQDYTQEFDSAVFTVLEKLILHSTETGSRTSIGWPGYGGGASAPNGTYAPRAARRQRLRQHFGYNESSRALRDPSSTPVRENRDNLFQLEIVAYSDYNLARSRGGLWIGDLEAEHYEDIAEIVLFLNDAMRLPKEPFGRWAEGQRTYVSGRRLTSSQFDAARGIGAHFHVSGNDHWDVGGFYISRLVLAIDRLEGRPSPPPTPPTTPPAPPTLEDDVTVIVSRYGSSQYVRIDTQWPYVERLSVGTYNSLAKFPGVQIGDGKGSPLTNAQINQQISLQGYRERRMRAVVWSETTIARDGQHIPVIQELANIRTEVRAALEAQDVAPWTYKGKDETRDAYAFLRGLDRKMDEVLAALPDAELPPVPDSGDIQLRRLSPSEVDQAAGPVEIPEEIPPAAEVMPPGLTYEPDEEDDGQPAVN